MASMFRRMPILPGGDCPPAAAAVLKKQNTPAGPAYPAHLTKGRDRIGKGTSAEGGDNRVKRAIAKSEAPGIHDRNFPGTAQDCSRKHAGAQIDGHQVETPRVMFQIRSGTGRNLEYAAGRRSQQARSQAA